MQITQETSCIFIFSFASFPSLTPFHHPWMKLSHLVTSHPRGACWIPANAAHLFILSGTNQAQSQIWEWMVITSFSGPQMEYQLHGETKKNFLLFLLRKRKTEQFLGPACWVEATLPRKGTQDWVVILLTAAGEDPDPGPTLILGPTLPAELRSF